MITENQFELNIRQIYLQTNQP